MRLILYKHNDNSFLLECGTVAVAVYERIDQDDRVMNRLLCAI